jgi:DNA replication factor GINS
MNDEISFRSIRNAQQKEKKNPYLQELEEDFFKVCKRMIKQLEKEYEIERKKSSPSSKLGVIENEIRNSRNLLEEIYKLREAKVLALARMASHGGDVKTDNMLSHELKMFDDVKQMLDREKRILFEEDTELNKREAEGKNKQEKLQKGIGEVVGEVNNREVNNKDKGNIKTGEVLVSTEGGTEGGAEEKHPGEPEEIAVVRILKDLPPFTGTDMKNYKLSREDVVCLPVHTADILLKQGNAQKVNTNWKS